LTGKIGALPLKILLIPSGGWGAVLKDLVGIGFAAWLAPIAAALATLALNPIIRGFTALAAAINLAYEAYQHWGEIKQGVKDYFSQGQFLNEKPEID
jgi:hypothetical protein